MSNRHFKTPEEAGEMWCPFTRTALVNAKGLSTTVCNRAFDLRESEQGQAIIPHNSQCIADRCMAWRHVRAIDGKTQKLSPGEGWKLATVDHDGHDNIWHKDIWLGYCGLAGVPKWKGINPDHD